MITFFDIWVSKRYLLPKTKDSFFSIITIFSFLGISLGVATLIIVMSVMNGFREELTSKVLGINGQMKVKLYNNQKINNYENIVSLLKETNPSVITHPTILSQGLINFKNLSTGVLIKGLDIDNLKERKLLSNKLSKDTLSEYKKNNGILVGNRLKEKFGLKKNDYVNLISPQGFKTPFGKLTTSQNYKIIGFFETGMYEYDLSLIIMPLKNLQTFLGVNENQVDSIEIFVNDFKSVNQFSKNIKNIIPKYFEVVDWRELNPSLFNAIEVERNVMFLILFLIILVAAFNLISSMIMLVNNKKKDIGILRTLGVTKYQLLKIFIINGFSIGLIGTFLGVILGISFCLNINEIKLFLEFLTDSNLFAEEIYFFSKLPIIINFNEIILIIGIALSLSFLATIYPSYKASKIEPIHLIKWE